jgi:hypothetical protein
MKWEPIATAPMDGAWVLLTGFKQGKTKTTSHMYVVGAWYNISDRHPNMGGNWYFADQEGKFVINPTHWSDLPDLPPKAKVFITD